MGCGASTASPGAIPLEDYTGTSPTKDHAIKTGALDTMIKATPGDIMATPSTHDPGLVLVDN